MNGGAGAGLNHGARPEMQWQVPHRHDHGAHEADFDLVEAAFVESFDRASDPTSFLRLAGVPLRGRAGDGRELSLLRVEQEQTTDVGSVTPQLKGHRFRYDPLPAAMVSQRRRLRFVYLDGRHAVAPQPRRGAGAHRHHHRRSARDLLDVSL